MQLYSWPLGSKYRTVKEIKHAVNTYYKDLNDFPELTGMDIREFYDYVKNIPYVRDVPESEIISRPRYLLTMFPALDCKKKTILMGSYMRLKYGPKSYRFCLSSNRPDGAIGHVFTQIYNGTRWINADATYAHNRLGAKKRVTNFEIMGR
jgi:hypothetical protein